MITATARRRAPALHLSAWFRLSFAIARGAFLTALTLAFTVSSFAQAPIVLEEDWRFKVADIAEAKQTDHDDSAWRRMHIPHNGQGLTNEPVFARTVAPVWFRRAVELPALQPGYRVVLQVTRTNGLQCWLNGAEAGQTLPNQGTFMQDVTSLVKPGRNVLALRTLLPGIQGHVRLHVLPPLHLDPRGALVDLPDWTGGPARVRVRTTVENRSESSRTVVVRAVVLDPSGNRLATMDSAPVVIAPGAKTPFLLNSPPVSQPPLWSPESPQLCTTTVELLERDQSLQRQTAEFGFRWFHFEPDGPFTLNGKRYPVRGVVYVEPAERRFTNRKALWDYEIGLLKGMGVNFVRTTRPIDQTFFDACNRAGLLITAPIHYFGLDDHVPADVESLVYETYNHPSLIAWHTNGEGKDAAAARGLSATTAEVRKFDPSHPVLCCELGWRTPGTVGLVDADIAGQGNYTGWYEGTLDHIGPYMDDYRALLRERYGRPLPVLVSNFGAAGVANLHTDSPRRNDFSHEYHTAFNERFYAEIEKRPWMLGGFIFCWRDLNSAQPIPRHTWKGMLDLKDEKKDSYYFYQSRWTTAPMVHIAQKTWTQRDSWPSGAELPVHVFSNGERVELFQDGKSVGSRTEQNNRFEWKVTYREGRNVLRAVAQKGSTRIEDTYTVDIRFRPPAVNARLLSQRSADGKVQRVLAWDAIPGVDNYIVSAGPKADFDLAQGVRVASVRSESTVLPANNEHPFYRVVASAKGVTGPASVGVGLQPGSLRWKFTNTGWLLSSPAIADLTGDGSPEIVIGSYNGSVYAVKSDGTQLWSYDMTDPVQASPAVAALKKGERPSIVVNSAKALYVLSNDGKLKWKHAGIRQFDRTVRSPTVADLDGDGVLEIIVGSDTGKLMVFQSDGRLRWEYSTAGPKNRGLSPTTCVVIDRPAGAGKALCFAADNGMLYLLDPQGGVIWTRDMKTGDSAIGLPPNDLTPAAGLMHDPKRVTLIAGGKALEALSPTGELIWERRDLSGFPQISNLFRDGNRQVAVASRRVLHVLDHQGRDVWKYTLPHPRDYFIQPPTSADLDADGEPDLVTGSRATNLIALSSRGKVLWSFATEDELTGSPAVADIDKDGIVDVVFGSRDGSLYVLSAGKAPPYAQEAPAYRGGNARTASYNGVIETLAGRFEAPGIAQRFEEVAYGADPLQKLDVYLPAATRPTAVLIELHGGGWRRGHKRQFELYGDFFQKTLAAGIAVVTANYRLTPHSTWPAQGEDAARVVQFVRANAAKWNIDPQRVGLIGGSAGGHLSLWVGLHDDLAKPQDQDPVRRQSTRVQAIVDCWAPTDLARAELVGRAREALPEFLGVSPEEWNTPRVAALVREVSPIHLVSADDPRVMIIHTEPAKTIPSDPNWKVVDVHSVLYGQLLKQKLDAVGVRAELVTQTAEKKPLSWVEPALKFVTEVLK